MVEAHTVQQLPFFSSFYRLSNDSLGFGNGADRREINGHGFNAGGGEVDVAVDQAGKNRFSVKIDNHRSFFERLNSLTGPHGSDHSLLDCHSPGAGVRMIHGDDIGIYKNEAIFHTY